MKRKITVLLTLLLIAALAKAQEPLATTKRIYFSDNNKLYVNKELGLYLWLSVSPDPNSEKIRLVSDSTKEYTNPMYLDMEGFNTIRSPWAVDTSTKRTVQPLRDIVFEVYADGLPPVSKAEFISKNKQTINEKKYYGSDLAIKITSKDEMSGVHSVYY